MLAVQEDCVVVFVVGVVGLEGPSALDMTTAALCLFGVLVDYVWGCYVMTYVNAHLTLYLRKWCTLVGRIERDGRKLFIHDQNIIVYQSPGPQDVVAYRWPFCYSYFYEVQWSYLLNIWHSMCFTMFQCILTHEQQKLYVCFWLNCICVIWPDIGTYFNNGQLFLKWPERWHP